MQMRRKFADWAVLAASANAEFLAALFLYVLLTLLASAALNFPIYIAVLYSEVFLALGAAITIPFFCVMTARAILVDRPKRPFEYVLRFWRSKFWNDWALPDRLSI
ncbi:MAG TPA: hypothetical protein VFW73_03350, partial [Lacipirellulaceae bacterium]|nr:hypothetical protein [Lacipirellulaceae bacterium]